LLALLVGVLVEILKRFGEQAARGRPVGSEINSDEFGALKLLGVDGLRSVAEIIPDDFLHFNLITILVSGKDKESQDCKREIN